MTQICEQKLQSKSVDEQLTILLSKKNPAADNRSGTGY